MDHEPKVKKATHRNAKQSTIIRNCYCDAGQGNQITTWEEWSSNGYLVMERKEPVTDPLDL